MLHTTFARARKHNACMDSYRKMAKALGGISKYGKDTPIPLDKVLEVCGLVDAIWALRCTAEDSENFRIEFACRCAEHVLHIYEEKYPDDKRPRLAIEAARACITDKSPAAWAAARAAGDAAWAAARAVSDAAWAADDAAWAADDAAWAAARAAWSADDAAWAAASVTATEEEWQKQTFLKMLSEMPEEKK